MLNIVLFQPEIPQNTGNIGRTCVAMGAKLWIVRPAGFRLDDKQLQRAGLDYWQYLDWEAIDSWPELEKQIPPDRMWFLTKFASKKYTDVRFGKLDWLIFGSESSGLPDSIRTTYADRCIGIPMPGKVRSLNLAVAAGIVAYEAYRQIDIDTSSGR